MSEFVRNYLKRIAVKFAQGDKIAQKYFLLKGQFCTKKHMHGLIFFL